MKRLIAAIAMSALMLAGCATGSDKSTAPEPEGAPSPALAVPAEAEPLLAKYRLAGKDTTEVIDQLDRLAVKDRPGDLRASIRTDQLVISGGTQEFNLALPDNRFYLSVAPYVTRTHKCFYHSLTTCKGELAGKEIGVKIVDDSNGTVLVDKTQTSFDNGFIGFWLPRDIKGTLHMSFDGKAGQTKISTDKDAPTCLTTLRLT